MAVGPEAEGAARAAEGARGSVPVGLQKRGERERHQVDLYEYQARDLFEHYGVPVLAGMLADTPEQVRAAAEQLAGTVVVKAQVKTGGRGKAGGVKVVHSPDDAATAAEGILKLEIKGLPVNRVMIAAGARIAQEFYFSILLDRANRSYLS